jgi:Ca2+-binding EF-hand superfamily protein
MMMEFLKDQKKKFIEIDSDRNGSLDLNELVRSFVLNGMPMPPEQVRMICGRYDARGSGALEFDEFLQMMIEWTQIGQFQSQWSGFAQQRAGPFELQRALGGITIFYRTINGVLPNIRPFSLATCRTLISMFGTQLPGEPFASGLQWVEYLNCMQYVKEKAYQFSISDLDHDGCISSGELQVAFARVGTFLPAPVIMQKLACYDFDRDGRISFDEFLQMLLEADSFHRKMQSMIQTVPQLAGIDPSILYQLQYSGPRSLFRAF